MVRRFVIRNLKFLILFLIFAISTISLAFAQDMRGENEEINSKISLATNKHCDEVSDVFKKNEDKIERKKKAEEKRKREIRRKREERKWESLGSCRITTYCPACNDPAGSYQSSSGTTLYEGCVACSWLPLGATLRINGSIYTVVDRCGTDAIDVFVDTSYCMCNSNYYTNVEIKKE